MHLLVFLEDEDILEKLEGWGVCPISKIKRRLYPCTNVEDGTRFVKVRFPREVVSLPYSTKLETEEGPQYFQVMHSHQVKTCRLCMSPDHVVKDCPEFKCFKCEERGHFARDCNAVVCPECNVVLNKCECWMGSEEEEEERHVDGQMHERDNERREEETMAVQEDETTENQDNEHQQKDQNDQEEQSQQDREYWTQMDLTDTLQNALDTVEQKDQGKNKLMDTLQDGVLWTQMDLTDSLQNDLDIIELNDQMSKEQAAGKESEEGKEEDQ